MEPQTIKKGEGCHVMMDANTGEFRLDVYPERVELWRKFKPDAEYRLHFIIERQ